MFNALVYCGFTGIQRFSSGYIDPSFIFVIFCLVIICEILIRSFNIVGLQGSDKNFFFSENDVVLIKPNSIFKVAGKKVKTDNNGFRIPTKNYKFDENKELIQMVKLRDYLQDYLLKICFILFRLLF